MVSKREDRDLLSINVAPGAVTVRTRTERLFFDLRVIIVQPQDPPARAWSFMRIWRLCENLLTRVRGQCFQIGPIRNVKIRAKLLIEDCKHYDDAGEKALTVRI